MQTQRFPKNARVVFIGDSITHNNLYVTYIADHYHRHFKEESINFYNTGISGASVNTALAIFDLDIVPCRPTHAVIMLGVNDSGRDRLNDPRTAERYEQLRTNFNRFRENLDTLCKKCAAIGASVTLCTPPPIDEYSDFDTPRMPGSYALMQGYADFIRAYAKDHGYAVCDIFNHMTYAMQIETLYREDRIHPTPKGHAEMAKGFLLSQGLEPDICDGVPAYMETWNRDVGLDRNIRAAEYMIVRSYTKSPEESMEDVRRFLETNENPYFENLGNCYLTHKPRAAEIRREMLCEMEIRLKA